MALIGRPLRLGVVGGGPGSFIGPIHRSAAVLDGCFRVVAGVVTSRPERAAVQGAAVGLDEARSYSNVDEMIKLEAQRVDGQGIEAVAVMTPNDCHFAECSAAMQAGLHVICDKPLANSVEEARALVLLARQTGVVFCLTHNYSGYPMVRQARAMVEQGALGAIRMVNAEYLQGGMASAVESGPLSDKLKWKLDATRGGPSLVMGDIGTHAHHLASFVAVSPVTRVAADVGSIVPDRQFDDFAGMLWRFANGARGVCCVSQAAAGAENNVTVRVYGERGMLEWQHAVPNYLRHSPLGEPARTLGRGDPYLLPAAQCATRISRGHPEGFRESFANLYADFAALIAARLTSTDPDPLALRIPTVEDGLRGILFVDAALQSSRQGGGWVNCALE